MIRRSLAALAAALFAIAPHFAAAQKVVQLKNQPPAGTLVEFLLTDGTVMVQSYNENTWYKLTPDNMGSYVNGTWKQLASLPSGYVPLYFASAVLADGRLVITGGEYNNNSFAFTNMGAIYDPVNDTWSTLKPPKGWINIGDSPSSMLPDGRFMVGNKFHNKVATLDPSTLTWTELISRHKNDKWNAEEGWTLMPDGKVLTWDVLANPLSEMYNPSTGKWKNLGNTPVNLEGPCLECQCIQVPPKNFCYYSPGETGPGILRPDGTVFATGATHQGESTGHTAIYSPRTGWTAGPDWPNGDQADDSSAALLPDGNVLALGSSGYLYEFDGTNFTRETVAGGIGGYTSLMVLPTGEVLVGGYEVYQPNGTYRSAWQPTISSVPPTVKRGQTYQISGTQFNGLSQAAAFGDEVETATNYPLVRITNNATGHVFYARTHDHSTMGVATGNTTVSTNFDVPSGMETGAGELEVVANGIPSQPVSVTVK
ncbi:MAG TPA: hypothetical protein VHT03_14605 [Rhizomicrobium sp.]|jgi:hypothetical protein|nr:hypothetical protein [Rhizomicrobium sp.]